jgi:hypothetical protein
MNQIVIWWTARLNRPDGKGRLPRVGTVHTCCENSKDAVQAAWTELKKNYTDIQYTRSTSVADLIQLADQTRFERA